MRDRALQSRYPGAELDLVDLTAMEQGRAFETGAIDVGFLGPPVDDEGEEGGRR